MFINTILEHSHTQISTDMYGCNAGDLGSILGLGRSPREGNGNPLQDSGLENSVDCIVHGVTKSWTRLSAFHYHYGHCYATVVEQKSGNRDYIVTDSKD